MFLARTGHKLTEEARRMKFAIETTCIVPISRQHVYEAETFEQALVMAVADNNWEGAKEDYEAMMIIVRRLSITGLAR
jgi:hypothetical protein